MGQIYNVSKTLGLITLIGVLTFYVAAYRGHIACQIINKVSIVVTGVDRDFHDYESSDDGSVQLPKWS